jgi:hypothetical protein
MLSDWLWARLTEATPSSPRQTPKFEHERKIGLAKYSKNPSGEGLGLEYEYYTPSLRLLGSMPRPCVNGDAFTRGFRGAGEALPCFQL